ncbi:hypothetical protein D9611_005987 [Ephemerocybe angulata]|uniref:Uncharacterized protein n=1 Tax=Ephemerocybe angulata TaxID=980116 RepID=A0A8H5FLK9_9AGAR|nr:hypothetical protein D9611_005987 [Tulosesus angulatus]
MHNAPTLLHRLLAHGPQEAIKRLVKLDTEKKQKTLKTLLSESSNTLYRSALGLFDKTLDKLKASEPVLTERFIPHSER